MEQYLPPEERPVYEKKLSFSKTNFLGVTQLVEIRQCGCINKAKITDCDSIDFLIGTQKVIVAQKRNEFTQLWKVLRLMMCLPGSSTVFFQVPLDFWPKFMGILI